MDILKVYDTLEREKATLVIKQQPPGKYSVRFNVAQISNLPGNKTGLRYNVSSGVYFYALWLGDSPEGMPSAFVRSLRSSEFKKMVLIK